MKTNLLFKKITMLVCVLAMAVGAQAQTTITYSQTFTSGVATSAAQKAAWNNFRAQLLSGYNYTKMKISGTYDLIGQETTDTTIIKAYANALRTGSNYTSPSTNGNVWSLCGSRYSGEVWLNPPSQCS